MLLLMKTTKRGKENGQPVRTFSEGEVYDIGDPSLIEVFIDKGWAVSATDTTREEKESVATLSEESTPHIELPDLEAMTVKELREFADDHMIDLGEVTRKNDIISTIKLALAD